jgi:drug/metabolite transporter (DMT)-like permease
MTSTDSEEHMEKAYMVSIILFIVASEAIAQTCIKKCKITQQWRFYLLAVFFYSLVCLGLYTMYGYKAMGSVNLIWSCLSILSILTVGVLFFHEEVNRYDMAGIVFIFIGLSLVFVKGH